MIKNFEEYKNDIKVDDYIIFKFSTSYGLFKILEIRENKQTFLIEKLYIYINELIKTDKTQHLITIRTINKKLLFKSDNLQECLDMLPLIANSNKYNL